MEEVFQNFKHYGDWILRKWRTDRVLDALIIKNELMIKREISCNGEPYRPLTEEEFNERNSQSFIKIPTIYESDDYQDKHRLAERKLNRMEEDKSTAKNPTDAKPVLAKVPEYLLCSAIWFDDGVEYIHQPQNIKTGFVICGLRHHNCFTTATIFMGIRKERLTKKEVQGFLTNKDRFVDRYEAAQIALASGQIKKPKRRLFSEDVW